MGVCERRLLDYSVGDQDEMKKLLLATVALVALGATVPALAADMAARPYTKAPPPIAAPIYNWTGFYIGGHIGAAFGNDNNFNGLVVSNNNDARFLGGVQGGFDYQFAPNWVLGAEAQYSWLSGNAVHAVFQNGYIYNNDRRGIGSVTGRIGYTWGPGLLYVKGGYAFADNNESLFLAGVQQPFGFDGNHKDGYTVGAGLEYMFAPNWSGKVEYQYYNFGDARFVAPVALVPFGSFHNDEHTIKAGINYRFNFGGPGPVVAKY
jgi:outer membrane immunogenic protein